MNELNFRLEIVREGLETYWEAQLEDHRPQRHPDLLEAIRLTGISFGDNRIATLIAEKLGHKIDREK